MRLFEGLELNLVDHIQVFNSTLEQVVSDFSEKFGVRQIKNHAVPSAG